MWLADLSIKRPVFVSMLVAAVMLVGAILFPRLGLDLFPDVSLPVVAVQTVYAGATPEEVEQLVSKPLEEAFSSLNGVETVTSTSREGVSIVVVQFKLDVPSKNAAADVRERLSAARGLLPADIREPVVQRFDPSAAPILAVAVSDREGRLTPDRLRALIDLELRPRLERVDGVAAVDLTGGLEREVHVDLDLARLQARGLAAQQVTAAIRGQNLNVPGGRVTEGRTDLVVRTTGEYRSVEEIARTPVFTAAGPVLLGDIATISDSFKDVHAKVRLDQREAVVLQIRKASGTNTVQVAERAKAELDRMLAERGDLTSAVAMDQSKFVRESTDDVMLALVLGAFFAGVVVFLFFRDLRNTLVTVGGLPVILLGTFAAFQWLGYSLNMITLMALSLSIGMLIDDAIVVRENIIRRMELGDDPVTASREGTREIALAVLATTFTIVAVFGPIAFTSGLIGKFFNQFGMTVVIAVLLSLLEAFTLAPMLSAYFFKQMDPHAAKEREARSWLGPFWRAWDAGYDRLESGYRRLLAWSLRHRWSVVGGAAALFTGSLLLVPLVGTAFIPQAEQGEFSVSLTLPAGTSLAETERQVARAETALLADPKIGHIFSTVGGGEGATHRATLQVTLKEKHGTDAAAERTREALSQMPGMVFRVQQADALTGSIGGGNNAAAATLRSSPIAVQIRANTLEELDALSAEAVRRMAVVPGLVDVDRTLKPGAPEARLVVDRTRATDLGLSAAQVGATVRTLVNGEVVGKMRDAAGQIRDTEIVVRLRPADRDRLEDILSVPLVSPSGAQVPLSAVTRIAPGTSPSQVERENRQRQTTVGGALGSGASLGDVSAGVRAALADLSLPPGAAIEITGQTAQMEESFGALGLSLALAVAFIYMVLASQFGSFVHPFTIMVALPLSIVGAFLALLVTRNPLDMMGMIGIILLMGLVTKNSILLIDYTIRLREEGMDRWEALTTAAPVRLRPILMTTLAMIFGMLPTAFGLGAGAELRAPMAITVVGGLITSTVLTLVVVPVAYTLIDDLGLVWRRVRRRSAAVESAAAADAPSAQGSPDGVHHADAVPALAGTTVLAGARSNGAGAGREHGDANGHANGHAATAVRQNGRSADSGQPGDGAAAARSESRTN